jgi:pimeloyl-ACP methyl ester carboxylesterase
MKIIKRILQGIGALLGIIIVYLAIVTFLPGISVPKQPLEHEKRIASEQSPKLFGTKEEVRFDVKGTAISAWLYLPENLSGPASCIIMGHGFGGTKDMGLESYALRYQQAGYAVLAFDYRHFGASQGEPRQLIWIPYQLEDWSAAITYARGLQAINPEKIALWGTSMSGGHVIAIAAKDHKITCVVAQCPGVDGRASGEMFFERVGIGYTLRFIMHGQRDYFRSRLGLSAHKIPIVGKPGSLACLTTPDVYAFFSKYAPENYVNEVCARINIRGDKYRPVKLANKVRCPVLLQICEHDNIIPKRAAEETEKQLGEYAEAIYYPIGHFDIYIGDNFEKAVSDQLEFFKKHL